MLITGRAMVTAFFIVEEATFSLDGRIFDHRRAIIVNFVCNGTTNRTNTVTTF